MWKSVPMHMHVPLFAQFPLVFVQLHSVVNTSKGTLAFKIAENIAPCGTYPMPLFGKPVLTSIPLCQSFGKYRTFV